MEAVKHTLLQFDPLKYHNIPNLSLGVPKIISMGLISGWLIFRRVEEEQPGLVIGGLRF